MGLIEETFRKYYEPVVFIKYTELFDYKSLNNYHTLYPIDIEETYKFLFRALNETTSFVSIYIDGNTYYIKDFYGELDEEVYRMIMCPEGKNFRKYRMEYKLEKGSESVN